MTAPETVDTTPHPVARDRALFEGGTCRPQMLDMLTEDTASSILAFDDVNVLLIPLLAKPRYAFYYCNGPFANMGAMLTHLGDDAIIAPTLLRAPVANLKEYKFWEHGLGVDVEPQLFTPAQAASIAKEAKSQDVRPRVYGPLSWMPQIVAALDSFGLRRGDVELRSAHWTGTAHICSGVQTVWGLVTMDSTQYTDKFNGVSCDASLCRPGSFGPWGGPAPQPQPKPKPKPAQKHATGQARAEIIIDWDKPVGRRISVHGTKGTWRAGTEQELELMQVGFWKDGTWKATGVPRRTKPLG